MVRHTTKTVNFMLINKKLITAKTENGIKQQIISQLREKGCIIVSSEIEAKENIAYNSNRDATEVELEEESISFSIEVENEDKKGYYTETFKVVLTTYYEDPGSDDYFYQVKIM